MSGWEEVVYIHNGIFYTYQNKINVCICDNLNEAGWDNAKWNKAEGEK